MPLTPRPTAFVLLAALWLLAAAPASFACSTPAECNVKGQFHRAQSLELSRSMNVVREPSRAYDSNSGVSGALAQSFKKWEDSQQAERNAATEREREADRKAVNVRFSADDIANDRRRVLIVGAEDGRAVRQNQLGVALLNGELGFVQNTPLALHWLRKAAAQGEPNALVNLAEVLIKGEYGAKPDPLTGLQLYALLVAQGGSAPVDQAAFTMNKAYEIYEKDPSFYPRALEAALNAQALGAPRASQVIFHCVVDFSVTPHDARLRALLESPTTDVDLLAARGLATVMGTFGITRDLARGRALLEPAAEQGHAGAKRFLALMNCLRSARSADEKSQCSF